jgi:hypothetical protein
MPKPLISSAMGSGNAMESMNDQPKPESERLTEALQRQELQERVNNLSGMLQVVTKEQQEELDKEARFRWELMEVTKEWAQEPPPHSLPAVIPNPSSPRESSLPASTPPFLRLSLEKQEELHQAFKAHGPSPPPSGR